MPIKSSISSWVAIVIGNKAINKFHNEANPCLAQVPELSRVIQAVEAVKPFDVDKTVLNLGCKVTFLIIQNSGGSFEWSNIKVRYDEQTIGLFTLVPHGAPISGVALSAIIKEKCRN